MEDRKSWAIKDDAILDELVSLMNFSDEEKQALLAAKEQAQAVAPQLADAFYERLTAHSNTAEYVQDKVDHLKNTLQKWFVELFDGEYGQEYVQNRLKIGQKHVRIGLPIRYPLAMMDMILKFGEGVARQSPQSDVALPAFRKLLALDIAIFNQAYERTQLDQLAQMVGNERLARRMLTE